MFEAHEELVWQSMALGERAATWADVPIGALVVDENGTVLARGYNTRERDADPTGHAEINALRAAAIIRGSWNLSGCTLAVNLEPCTMCAGAIINSRISRVIFGAWDEKAGAAGSMRDILRDPRLPHTVEVIGGVLEKQAQAQLREWFSKLRAQH
ncbi:MAG: nucleoside deaminase [Actinomycetaceae bacterium]|nr:nucleoside deaminase [Actinomycetaceae bacterium]MDY5855232.1 nucleoside deaminase [Arcanobacterium sp.]